MRGLLHQPGAILAAAVLASCAAACAHVSEPHVTPDADAGIDLVEAPDLADDPLEDVIEEVMEDLPSDAPVDLPPDTMPDVPFDTTPDAVPDAPVDPTVDDGPADPATEDGTTGCSGTIFSTDLESDSGGFTEYPSTSVWEWGSIVSGAPSSGHGRAWATNLSGLYGACEDARITSPDIDLSACGGRTMTLTFETWYEYERYGLAYYDGFIVELWNGASWVKIAPVGGWDHTISIYGCSGIHVAGEEGFAHTSGGWVTKTFTVTLTSYPSDFKFRFYHGSDSDGHYNGAFVDNIRLTAS